MATHVGFTSDRTAIGTWPAARSHRSRPLLSPGNEARTDRVLGAQEDGGRRVLPGSLDEMERCCRTLETKRAQGDMRGMATCCLQIGDLFLLRGDTELAEQMYRRALMLSRNLRQGELADAAG